MFLAVFWFLIFFQESGKPVGFLEFQKSYVVQFVAVCFLWGESGNGGGRGGLVSSLSTS